MCSVYSRAGLHGVLGGAAWVVHHVVGALRLWGGRLVLLLKVQFKRVKIKHFLTISNPNKKDEFINNTLKEC